MRGKQLPINLAPGPLCEVRGVVTAGQGPQVRTPHGRANGQTEANSHLFDARGWRPPSSLAGRACRRSASRTSIRHSGYVIADNKLTLNAGWDRARTDRLSRRWNHWCNNSPFVVGQIAWITQGVAVRSAARFEFHMGRSFANQAPKKSHPIHPTQELPGSALSVVDAPEFYHTCGEYRAG